MTTPFDIIESELLGKQIAVYKKTIEHNGEISFRYSMQNDYIHRFEVETIRQINKVTNVKWLDGDYEMYPSIEIELDNDIIINIEFDTLIEYA
jgi:predicted ribonuclease toxin of YeeF-YezG toxin-antitoxin module